MLERLITAIAGACLLCAGSAFFRGNACATESITLKNGEEVRCDIIERQEGGYRVRLADGTTKVYAKSSIDGLVHEDDNPVCRLPMKQEEAASEPERKVELAVPKAEPKAKGGPVNNYRGDMPKKILFGENPDVRQAIGALEELLAKDTLPPKGDEPEDYMTAARDARARGDWDLAILNIYRQEQEDNRFDSDARFAALEAMKAGSVVGMMCDCLRQYKDKIDLKDLGDKVDEYLNNATDTLQRQQKSKTDPAYRPVYDTVSAIHQAADDLVRKGKEGGGIGGSSRNSGSGSSTPSGQDNGGIDPNQLAAKVEAECKNYTTQADKAAALRREADLLNRYGKKSPPPSR